MKWVHDEEYARKFHDSFLKLVVLKSMMTLTMVTVQMKNKGYAQSPNRECKLLNTDNAAVSVRKILFPNETGWQFG